MPCMLPAGAAKCPESKLKTNINVVGTGNTRRDREKLYPGIVMYAQVSCNSA